MSNVQTVPELPKETGPSVRNETRGIASVIFLVDQSASNTAKKGNGMAGIQARLNSIQMDVQISRLVNYSTIGNFYLLYLQHP